MTERESSWQRGAMWRAALVVSIVLVGAACSGDDDAVPPTSALVTTPSTTEVTVESTTTEVAATSPPTTSGSSTPATSPPESTSPPLTADQQAVVDAVVASWTAWNDVLLDPFDDARIERIALTHTGEALQRVVDVVASRRSENRRSLTNADFPAYIEPDATSVVVDLEAGTAEIEYCHLDSNVAIEIGGNADGTDLVLDDSVAIRFERETFTLVDGSWLKSGGESIEAIEGETTCPQ